MKRATTIFCAALIFCAGVYAQVNRQATVKVSVDPIELSDALNAAITQEGAGDQLSVEADTLNSSIIVSGHIDTSRITGFIRGLEDGELLEDEIPASFAPVLWLYDMDFGGTTTVRQEFHNVDVRALGEMLSDLIARESANHSNVPILIKEYTDDYIDFIGEPDDVEEIVSVLVRLDNGDPVFEYSDEEELKPIRELFQRGKRINMTFYPKSVDVDDLAETFRTLEAAVDHLPVILAGTDGESGVTLRGSSRDVEQVIGVLRRLDAGESVGANDIGNLWPVVDLFVDARNPVSRIVKLEYGVTPKVHELVSMYGRGGSGGEIRIDLSESLGWIRVQGPTSQIDEFEQLIAEIDVAPVNVEVTFYLMLSTDEARSEVPASIRPAVSKILDTFGLNALTTIDILQMRGSEGRDMEFESALPLSKLNLVDDMYQFARVGVDVKRITASQYGDTNTFSFGDVQVNVSIQKAYSDPNGSRAQVQYRDIGAKMQSSLDIREGQSVVLGKSNFDNTDRALFVIVQARKAD